MSTLTIQKEQTGGRYLLSTPIKQRGFESSHAYRKKSTCKTKEIYGLRLNKIDAKDDVVSVPEPEEFQVDKEFGQ